MKTDAWLLDATDLAGLPELPELRSPLLDAKVMLVDDEPLMTELIQTHLEEAGYRRFAVCNDPTQALAVLREQDPSVLLLDLMMPAVSGFDLLARIRAEREWRALPVIVLTASANAETKLRALKLGATEFLAKPVDASELVLRLRNTLAFKQYHDRRANLDAATQLPNAAWFERRLARALPGWLARGDRVALLDIQVPECASLRATLGLAAATQLARTLAERLTQLAAAHAGIDLASDLLEAEPTLARLALDSFALLLPRLPHDDDMQQLASDMLRELARPVLLGAHECRPTPAIGVALAPDDAAGVAELMKAAELARTQARGAGGMRHEFFSRELSERARERLELGEQLRHAADRGELRLHYQPKLDVASGRIVGVEALVRWMHPQRGLVAPGLFVPLAEELGLIARIGDWVLHQACADGAAWDAAALAPVRIAVNVSQPQFDGGTLVPTLRRALAASGLAPERLVIELTESMLMRDAEQALAQMRALEALGVSLSIDDFGTGYSSFSYLKRFPLDELKIDRSFVADLPGGARDRAIVRSVIAIGHDLGLSVIAEGVETREQLAALAELGCDMYQGFHHSRPMPPQALRVLLAAQPPARTR
ncbi:MAG: EAL domain-containing protein [Burkholderiales bacterium]|nr:EAL domain-containing protein [Burkholderiales bacterium]